MFSPEAQKMMSVSTEKEFLLKTKKKKKKENLCSSSCFLPSLKEGNSTSGVTVLWCKYLKTVY